VGPLDGAVDALVLDDSPAAQAAPAVRRGSPFLTGARLSIRDGARPAPATLAPGSGRIASEQSARRLAGAISVLLGVIALSLAFVFPLGAVAIAAAGIGLAIWGANARSQRVGILALLFSCMALAVSAYLTVVQFYRAWGQ
jgi:hypothetical protein